MLEQHYSVKELAARWALSAQSIIRMFENAPGVLVLGNARCADPYPFGECRSRGRRTDGDKAEVIQVRPKVIRLNGRS